MKRLLPLAQMDHSQMDHRAVDHGAMDMSWMSMNEAMRGVHLMPVQRDMVMVQANV